MNISTASGLQTIKVSIHGKNQRWVDTKILNRKLDIVNVYNPNNVIQEVEWDRIIGSIGKNELLIEDCNAHNQMWTTRRSPNATGRFLVNAIIRNFMWLATPQNMVTFMDSSRNYNTSTLDLVFATSAMRDRASLGPAEDLGQWFPTLLAPCPTFLSHISSCPPPVNQLGDISFEKA